MARTPRVIRRRKVGVTGRAPASVPPPGGRVGGAGAYEAYELGFGDPVPLSAEHGEGLSDLYDAICEALPEQTNTDR